MHKFQLRILSAVLVGLGAACSAVSVDPTLTEQPDWSIGDTWTIETTHARLMAKTTDDPSLEPPSDALWTFAVDAEGFVDGVDAWRVSAKASGTDDEYLTLYYRKADLGLIRIEEIPTNHRGGAKRITRNLFGDAPAFPVVTDNALVPYNMPAFNQPSRRFVVDKAIEGFGRFNAEVTQSVVRDGGRTIVTLEQGGVVVEQIWEAGKPFWSEQTVDNRGHAALVQFVDGDALSHGPSFDIDTDGSTMPMPTHGEARYMPWAAGAHFDDPDSGEATGVWSGHWWPMLEGPGKRLLYSDDGPMDKYDRYVEAITGSVPGAKAWEDANHHTTESNTGWWGHCNGWSASSVLEDEPTVGGSGEGIYFSVGDKKGLLAEIHNGGGLDLWVGSRHNGRSENGSIVNDPDAASYKDVLPYDLHRTLVEQIGIQNEAVVMDVNAGYQVWNYPAYKYDMSFSSHPDADKVNVTTTVTFVSFASADYVGLRTHSKTYRYWLTVDADGNPVQGPSAYTGGSISDHPDFIWHPYGTGTGNPVKYNRIREIVELGQTQGGGDDHPNTAADTDDDDTLRTGEILDGAIEAGGDVDYFRFDAEAGYAYTIETFELGSGSDTYMYLLGTDGTSELDRNDDGGEGYASRIRYEVTMDGTYYVRIRHYAPAGTGTYRITLSREQVSTGSDDRPDSIGDVTDNDLLSATPLSARIESAGDVDFFAFDAVSGSSYTIETSNLIDGMDTVIELQDADGNKIASDDDGGLGYASRLTWTATETGRVYVMVRHYYETSGTGGYSIQLDTE